MPSADLPTLHEALQELKARSEHASATYEPGNVEGWDQLSFHKSTARYRLIFGGNQSGKSKSAAVEIAWWLQGNHPHRKTPKTPIKIWSISAEYSTLQSGICEHLKELIPPWEIDKYGPNVPQQDLPSYIRLKNGSQVTFKSAKGDSRMKFQAAAVDLISIDEEVQSNIWTEIQARTLAKGGQFIISATLVESFEWIVDLEERAEAEEPGYHLTRLNTTKNTYLHQETVQHFKDTWSEEEKETRLYGKSRRSQGLIYTTWNPKIHIIPRFQIPKSWPRFCSLDPGFRTFAALWIAVGPDEHAYGYRELYMHGAPLWEVAAAIRRAEGWILNQELTKEFNHYVWEEGPNSEEIVTRLIDDKRESKLITGDPGVMSQLYEKYGIGAEPAQKAVRVGIEAVRHWLEPLPDGKPGFVIFDTGMENFILERKKYRIRTKDAAKESNEPIDVPIKKLDHLMDNWRYIRMIDPKWDDRVRLETEFEEFQPDRAAPRKVKEVEEYNHDVLGVEW